MTIHDLNLCVIEIKFRIRRVIIFYSMKNCVTIEFSMIIYLIYKCKTYNN